MSEPALAQTETSEPVATETPEPSAEDVAAELFGVIAPRSGVENQDVEAAAEPAAEPGEEAKDDKPEKPDEKPDDEKPWTKERIQEERTKVDAEKKELADSRAKYDEELRELRLGKDKLHRNWTALEKKSQKVNAAIAKWKQDRQQAESFHQWVSGNAKALKDGDAESRLKALGSLMGMSPTQAYEELTMGIASNGAKTGDGGDRQLKAALDKIDGLERLIRERDQKEKSERTEAEKRAAEERDRQHVLSWKQDIVAQAKDSKNHNALARLAAARPDVVAADAEQLALTFYKQNRRAIDIPSILDKLQERYSVLWESPPPEKREATGSGPEANQEPAAAAAAKPETTQSPSPGQSISQSAGSGAQTRAMTEQERLEKAASMLPDLFGER